MAKDSGGSKKKKNGAASGKSVVAKKKSSIAPTFKKGGFSAFGQLLKKGKNGGNSLSTTGGVKTIELGSQRSFKINDSYTAAKEKRLKKKKPVLTASTIARQKATALDNAEFDRQQASLFERSAQHHAGLQSLQRRKDLTRQGLASSLPGGANAFSAAAANATLFVDRRTAGEIDRQRVDDVEWAMQGIGGAPGGGGGHQHQQQQQHAIDHSDFARDRDYDPTFHAAVAEKYTLQKKRKGKKSKNAFEALVDDDDDNDNDDGGGGGGGGGGSANFGKAAAAVGVMGGAGMSAFFSAPQGTAAAARTTTSGEGGSASKGVGAFNFAKPAFFYEGDMTNPSDTLEEEEAFRGKGR